MPVLATSGQTADQALEAEARRRREPAFQLRQARQQIAVKENAFRDAADRLERAVAWFSTHASDSPDYGRAWGLRQELERRCVGAYLQLSWIVPRYAELLAACPDMRADEAATWRDVSPEQGRAWWLLNLPCPHRCARLIVSSGPWVWWPKPFDALPDHGTECFVTGERP